MKIIFYMFLSLTIIVFGCSRKALIFSTETNDTVNFSKYKTFAFLPVIRSGNAIIPKNKEKFEHNLATNAATQLEKRGMKLDTVYPDCFFKYTLVLNHELDVMVEPGIQYSEQTYQPPGKERIYFFGSNNKPVVYEKDVDIDTLKNGSLVLDMIDATNNNLIWRSKAEGSKEQNQIPAIDDVLHRVVPRMFKHFPK